MNYCDGLKKHYESFWARAGEQAKLSEGPVTDLPREFGVLRFPPAPGRPPHTYATVCMSQPSDASSIELHLFSRIQTADHVELLTVIAHYHRTAAKLGLGHTVNFGRPWLPGSECTHGLISLPYLDGPNLENLMVHGKAVRFLWLIPVTEGEVAFKKRHGLQALESRFEKAQFDYLDVARASVV